MGDWDLWNGSTVTIERKRSSGTSATGETTSTVATVQSSVPCQIDPVDVKSSENALQVTVAGVQYLATHVLFCDGLTSLLGYTAGEQVNVNGTIYTVTQNVRGAFVDIQPNDRITDEEGIVYLALAVDTYTDIMPHIEVRLRRGSSW